MSSAPRPPCDRRVYELVEDVAGSFADMAGLPDVLAERIKQPRRKQSPTPSPSPSPTTPKSSSGLPTSHPRRLASYCPAVARRASETSGSSGPPGDMNGFKSRRVAIQKLLSPAGTERERFAAPSVRPCATPAYPQCCTRSWTTPMSRRPSQISTGRPSRLSCRTSRRNLLANLRRHIEPGSFRPDAHTPKAEAEDTVEEEGRPALARLATRPSTPKDTHGPPDTE